MATGELLGDELHGAQHLPADLMLVKMEGEHIMTMAASRRLPIATVIKEACDMLAACPEAAHQAVYSKPVGLKPDRCRTCRHEIQRKSWQKFNVCCPKCHRPNNNMIEGKMQYARGLSIRAMESLSNLIGYNRLASSTLKVGDGLFKVTAIFTDYARGIIRSEEDLVSQWKKDRNGGLYKEDEARFVDMSLKAAKSKTKRNAVKDGLPFELRQAYENKAIEVAPKFLTPDKIKAIVESFEDQGIHLGDLNLLLRREKADKWTAADAETLRGIWTALENGEMTVDELLAECRRPLDAPLDSEEEAGSEPVSSKGGKGKPSGSAAAVTAELTGSNSTSETVDPVKTNEKNTQDDAQQSSDPPAAKTKEKPARGTTSAPAATAAAQSPPAEKTKTAPAASPSTSPKGRKSMTADGLKAYLAERWEEESPGFNLELLTSVAVDKPDPRGYIDSVIKGELEGWENYLLPEKDADEPEELIEEGGEASQVGPADEGEQVKPRYITHPEPRPRDFGEEAQGVEKHIIGRRNPDTLRVFAKSDDLAKNPHLMSDERDYLKSLANRRAYQLQHGLQTTDRVP